MTENVDNYKVERDGDYIYVYFLDLFGEGEKYTLPLKDAKKLARALNIVLKLKG